jgi:hypothetical protein
MQAPLQARNDSDAAQTDTARTVAQKRDLADNWPEAAAQRKLAEMMNDSPRMLQQRALSDAIHNSPRMVAQRHEMNPLFGRAVKPQGDGAMPAEASPAQREEKTNNTGLPNQLKSGIESLSRMSMDHVKVHYNSNKPAQLQAHAYAQGSEIHLGAGQERHLPHEAWHIVQQAQGRVRPTLQMKAGAVNDDPSLEKEADMMGEKAAQFEGDHVARNLVAEERVAGAVTQSVAGFGTTMKTFPDKPRANGAAGRPAMTKESVGAGAASPVVDLRSGAAAQRRLQEQANHGTRTKQLRRYQDLGNQFSGRVLQRALATYEAINEADNGDHPIVDNRKFNAGAKPNPHGAAGTHDTGLGVERGVQHDGGQHNLGFATTVNWSAPTSDGEHQDGTAMSALLGPDHKRGSAPGSSGDWVDRRVKLSAASGKHDYIAGHLLNHNLGGPGNAAENLAAIPSEINKAHSAQIEEDVKTQVNERGAWGQYDVNITHANDAGSSGLLYASRLQATWKPYALDRPMGLDGTPGKFQLSQSSGQQISVDLAIPAPSAYKPPSGAKKSKATATKAVINARSHPVAGATLLAPLFTPFNFDELPLTPRTSLIVGIGIGNVLLIKKLQAEKSELGEQSLAAESAKVALKKSVDEYEHKLEQLEAEKAALLEEFGDYEAEVEMSRQRHQAETALRQQLLEQIEVINAEKRNRAETIGSLAGRLGEDRDRYAGGMSPISASRFDEGFEGAEREPAMAHIASSSSMTGTPQERFDRGLAPMTPDEARKLMALQGMKTIDFVEGKP